MNLKSAAKRLGVHYQTAYRYVRAGELIATRMGAGYDVSEAAIERFLARRESVPEAAHLEAGAPLPAQRHRSTGDVRGELEVLLASTSLSARPVFDLVTRWLAETLGDGCLLRLIDDDGQWMDFRCSYHVDPAARAKLAAVVSRWTVPLAQSAEGTVARTATTLRIDHVAVGRLAKVMPSEFHQYDMAVYSAVVAPVLGAGGKVRGTLIVWKDSAGRLYPPETEALVEEMATWVGRALERAERFIAGWSARGTLHSSVEAMLRRHPRAEAEELRELVTELLDERLPEAAFGLDQRLIVANELFTRRFGSECLAAAAADDLAQLRSCAWRVDELVWNRLISGAVDFLDQGAAACPSRLSTGATIHWAVARRPDATPALVVATCAAASAATPIDAVEPEQPLCRDECGARWPGARADKAKRHSPAGHTAHSRALR